VIVFYNYKTRLRAVAQFSRVSFKPLINSLRGGCEATNEDTPLPSGHRLRSVRGLPPEE
jgi:hypothetical protein